jgi:hypothetical protein
MGITNKHRWHTGDWVIVMRDAIIATSLISDIRAEGVVTKTGSAERVLSRYEQIQNAIGTSVGRNTKSVLYPLFLSSAAARLAMAPPKLWPVTAMRNPGFLAAAVLIAWRTGPRASTQDVQKPQCAVHPLQISTGMRTSEMSESQLRTDAEPRKDTIVRRLV